jgi:hypothetical protein
MCDYSLAICGGRQVKFASYHKPLGFAGVYVVLGMLAASAIWIGSRHDWTTKQRLADQWATVSDEEAEGLADRMALFGVGGINALVTGMASPRERVAEAAIEALHRELLRWERLPAQEAGTNLGLLARSLADSADEFGPSAKSAAAEFAMRALVWPSKVAGAKRSRLVADCERIFQASAGSGNASSAAIIARPARNMPASEVLLVSYEESIATTPSGESPLANSNLPVDLLQATPLERQRLDAGAMALVDHDEPANLTPDPSARRLADDARPVDTATERANRHAVIAAGAIETDEAEFAGASHSAAAGRDRSRAGKGRRGR